MNKCYPQLVKRLISKEKHKQITLKCNPKEFQHKIIQLDMINPQYQSHLLIKKLTILLITK